MKRALGNFETAAAISGEYAVWNVVGALLLDVTPPPGILRQALDILQVRHPFLKARLVMERGGHFLESGDVPKIPLEIQKRENDDHWIAKAEDGLNYKFDHATGPLFRCTALISETGKGEIILTAQHSIVDGRSMLTLFQELMDISAKVEAGADTAGYAALMPLPPSETYFPREYQGLELKRKALGYFARQMGGEMSYQLSLRGKRKPPINLAPRARIIQTKTSKETTKNLTIRGRKERVTLNSILNAALLLSVRKHLYAGESMAYRYMAMADLRPYLTPKPADNLIASYISPMRYTIQIEEGDDLWSVARRMNEQIYESAKRGEKYLASVMAKQFLQMTFMLKQFRMCTTAISYGGVSKFQREYGPYRVNALRGFVSNFGLGPEFSGWVELHEDELWWDMIYLDSDMDETGAKKIVDEVRYLLERAI